MIKKFNEFINENNNLKEAPKRGYILPNWDMDFAWRATALAYIDREGIWTVENEDGLWYSRVEIENSMMDKEWTDYDANMNESNESEDDYVCPQCGDKGTIITVDDEILDDCPNCGYSELEINMGQYD